LSRKKSIDKKMFTYSYIPKAQTFTWEITEENINQMQNLAGLMVEQEVLENSFDVKEIIDLTWQNKQ
jgi:hypothetical protein